MNKNKDSIRQGQKYFLKGNLPESIKHFSAALDENIESSRALLSRGVAHLKLGELDEAIDDFSKALDHGGDRERAYFYRGIARLNRGDYEEAIEDLDATLKLNCHRGAAFLARGMAHAELSHDREASRDLQNSYVQNNVVIDEFIEDYAISRTMFNRSMALFDGDRGPWSLVLTEDEIQRMENFH